MSHGIVFLFMALLSMIISRPIHVVANGIILFFLMARWYPHCIYAPHFIHSSVDGHLDCLRVLAMVNSAAMNLFILELEFCLDLCRTTEV